MTPEQWGRVKQLLQDALDRPSEDRAAFLAGACPGDEELHRQVESLLAASDRASDFMEAPAGRAFNSDQGASVPVRHVGPYRLLREIGRGGMAAVYLAVRDDGEYRKDVAIKVVQHAFASQFIVSRLRQERQILADLEHDHIARLLDGGTTEDGFPYLVLEYIAGSPIDAYCDEHGLSLTDRLRLFGDVCAAVSYAHQRHVIHRDLKPSNILVTADGTAKLLDFGIAKLLDPSGAPGALTVAGWQLMTPAYSSPEQIRGEPVGVAADVYALGVLLYRLISGRSPYRPLNDQPHELARAICEDEPEKPGVDSGLDAIVIKALSKEARDRYASVEEFANDVRRYLDRSPIAARRVTPARRMWRMMRRPAARRIAAVLLLIGATGLVGVVNFRRDARLPPMTVTDLTTLGGSVSGPSFSPDGSSIAFSWTGDQSGPGARPGIYTVSLHGGTPRLLTGGFEGQWPVWSPDGSRIAFIRDAHAGSGIFIVAASGGPERKLVDLRDDRHLCLAWSPDGKYLAFAERDSPRDGYAVQLVSVETLERRKLVSSSQRGPGSVLRFAFSPDGQTFAFIDFGNEGVDVNLLSLRDHRTRVLVARHEWIGGLAWAPDGRSLILSLNDHGARRLMKAPVPGGSLELLAIGEDAYYPTLTAGNRLAFVRELSDTDVWRLELNATSDAWNASPLIRSTRREESPRFSPDGKQIAFASNRSGSPEIWTSDADGGNQRQLTFFAGPNTSWPTWSPDGRSILFWAGALYVVPREGGAPRRVNATESGGELPLWSRHGGSIYFATGAPPNIWRMPESGGQAIQVTTKGGFSARESPDGRYLYYSKNDVAGIWRVPLSGGDETRVIPEFPPYLPDDWEVIDTGIYFVDDTFPQGAVVKFLEFASGRTTVVARLAGPVVPWGGGLTVAPDRRSIVYTQSVYNRTNIVLVENAR